MNHQNKQMLIIIGGDVSPYSVLHKHNAQTCLAKDPIQGSKFISHLSPINTRRSGISTYSDAVLDNQHFFSRSIG